MDARFGQLGWKWSAPLTLRAHCFVKVAKVSPSPGTAHAIECFEMLPPQLKMVDWATKRKIIRVVVRRIEIGPTGIGMVLRLAPTGHGRGLGHIVPGVK